MKTLLFLLLHTLALALPRVELASHVEMVTKANTWLHAVPNHGTNWITGQSMLPHLRNGDQLLLVEHTFWTPLYVGDLICFERSDILELTCHPIIAVKPGFVKTKGINNPFDDGWIPIRRVKWVVKGVIRVTG